VFGQCAPSSCTVSSAGDSSGRPGLSDGLQGRYRNSLIGIEGHLLKPLAIGYKDLRPKEAKPLEPVSFINHIHSSTENQSYRLTAYGITYSL